MDVEPSPNGVRWNQATHLIFGATIFLNFRGPIISLDWVKLGISIFVLFDNEERGCVQGQVTSFNFEK